MAQLVHYFYCCKFKLGKVTTCVIILHRPLRRDCFWLFFFKSMPIMSLLCVYFWKGKDTNFVQIYFAQITVTLVEKNYGSCLALPCLALTRGEKSCWKLIVSHWDVQKFWEQRFQRVVFTCLLLSRKTLYFVDNRHCQQKFAPEVSQSSEADIMKGGRFHLTIGMCLHTLMLLNDLCIHIMHRWTVRCNESQKVPRVHTVTTELEPQ